MAQCDGVCHGSGCSSLLASTDATLRTEIPTPTTHATTSPVLAQHRTTPNTSHTLPPLSPLLTRQPPLPLLPATTRATHHSQPASTGKHPKRPSHPRVVIEVNVEVSAVLLAGFSTRLIALDPSIQCMSCRLGRRRRRGRGLRAGEGLRRLQRGFGCCEQYNSVGGDDDGEDLSQVMLLGKALCKGMME